MTQSRLADRLRAVLAEKTRDWDYVYVVWVEGSQYTVNGFLDPARLVKWLKQEHARLPDRIDLR